MRKTLFFWCAALTLLFTLGMSAASRAATHEPGDELPDGEGKKILQAACTSCHDLEEVTKFGGYYDRTQWRDVVVTMVDYGAEMKREEIEVLADYLAEHLGKK